jgi:PEGA domain
MHRARGSTVTPSVDVKPVAPFRPNPAPKPDTPARQDATSEFASETKPAEVPPRPPLVIKIRKQAMVAIGLTLGVLGIAGAVLALTLRTPAATPTGSLTIETDPSGAEVQIDNAVGGTTPLSVTLPEGTHRLTVQRGLNVKQMNVEITSGVAKAYHIAWAAPVSASLSTPTGSLSVISDTAGSTVTVDGSARGQTPLTIQGLSAGRHEVVVRGTNATYQRSVQVTAGATASLVVGGAPAPSASWGWISLKTPFPVQVLEGGRVVGTSEIDRIMLSPGNHELDFVAEQFDFRERSKVDVLAGRGAPVSLTIPYVAMNINALPWAEVFVDGTRIGDTPLANVQQPIGDHEIVFRHPQFGEKRQMARVTLRDSLRISVDMRSR